MQVMGVGRPLAGAAAGRAGLFRAGPFPGRAIWRAIAQYFVQAYFINYFAAIIGRRLAAGFRQAAFVWQIYAGRSPLLLFNFIIPILRPGFIHSGQQARPGSRGPLILIIIRHPELFAGILLFY